MVTVVQLFSGADDVIVMDRAVDEGRVVLTRDRDFGELVYNRGMKAAGIVLLRQPLGTLTQRVEAFVGAWARIEAHAVGRYVVVARDRIRVRDLP